MLSNGGSGKTLAICVSSMQVEEAYLLLQQGSAIELMHGLTRASAPSLK